MKFLLQTKNGAKILLQRIEEKKSRRNRAERKKKFKKKCGK